jgi:hypothetical protein
MPDDPLWINASAGAPAYAANELRRAMAVLFTQSGEPDRFGAREGVHPAGSAGVTVSGMTVTVQHLKAVVYPGLTTLSGPYIVQLQSGTHAVTAADATNPRKDIVALQIQDHDEDSSGQRRAQSVYVAGTPAPSPVEPALPANSFRLATVDVPAGSTTPSLTYNAPLTVAAGGIVPVRNDAELPGSSSGMYDGAARWKQDTNELQIHNGGSVWETVAKLAKPFRGYVEDSTGASTTSETYSGVSITVPSADNPAGARFKVDVSGHLDSTVNDDSADLRVRRGTSTSDPLVISSRRTLLRASATHAGGFRVDDPPAGAVTYGLFIARASGTGTITLSSSAGFQGRLTVEHWDDAGT